jgi:hypothetical protein
MENRIQKGHFLGISKHKNRIIIPKPSILNEEINKKTLIFNQLKLINKTNYLTEVGVRPVGLLKIKAKSIRVYCLSLGKALLSFLITKRIPFYNGI